MKELGYLRETEKLAQKAGKDKFTGLCRTGLDTYLKIIFPEIDDWIHNRTLPDDIKKEYTIEKNRPDYRSEKLKIIVEFDGLQHYQYVVRIITDLFNTGKYIKAGYKVIRIPFFIQISNSVCKTIFGRDCKNSLFNEEKYHSLNSSCYPASLCPLGIMRMATEFRMFKTQFKTNMDSLKKQNDDMITGRDYINLYYKSKNKYDNLKNDEEFINRLHKNNFMLSK